MYDHHFEPERLREHKITQGYSEYFQAKRMEKIYIDIKNPCIIEQSVMPLRHRGVIRRRTNLNETMEQRRARDRRAETLSDICRILDEKTDFEKKRKKTIRRMDEILKEASVILAIRILQEIRSGELWNCKASSETPGKKRGYGFDENERRKARIKFAAYAAIKEGGISSFDAGLTSAFEHDVASIVFYAKEGEEITERLVQCCRAFLLVNVMRINGRRKGNERKENWTRHEIVCRCKNSIDKRLQFLKEHWETDEAGMGDNQKGRCEQ